MTAQPHILLVNPFAAAISGPDESLLQLLSHLPPGQFRFSLALPRQSPYAERYRQLGVTVVEMKLDRLCRSFNPLRWLSTAGRTALCTLRLARYIRRHKVDLVHSNMEVTLSAGLAARLCRRPSLYHYRGNADSRRSCFFEIYFHLLYLLADRVLAISQAVAGNFCGHRLAAKTAVLYNTCDLQQLAGAAAVDLRQIHVLPASALLVGTMGRFHPRKRLDLFLRTCAAVGRQLPEAHFLLIGDATSPEEERYKWQLRQLARELGVEKRLLWCGVQSNIAGYLRGLDLFVICSEREGFGRVVLEAQAAGLAVVGPDEGGIREIVENGRSGLLCPEPGPAALAAAVLTLLRDPPRRRQMGIQGQARAAALFSPPAVCRQLQETYRALLAEGVRS